MTRAARLALCALALLASGSAVDAFGPRPRPRLYHKVRAPDNHDAIAAPLARDPRLETEPALPSSRSRISPRISSPRTARSANSPLAVPPPPGCSATVDGAFPTTTTTADPPTLPST